MTVYDLQAKIAELNERVRQLTAEVNKLANEVSGLPLIGVLEGTYTGKVSDLLDGPIPQKIEVADARFDFLDPESVELSPGLETAGYDRIIGISRLPE